MLNHVHIICTVSTKIMATTTLDQYNFRQQRRRSPDLKDPVIKQETKPQAVQQQQQDHSKEENDIQTLKAFDLDYVYGPAVGISRLERWERARSFGLNPPLRVKQLIDQHSHDPKYTECLWSGTLVSGDQYDEEQ